MPRNALQRLALFARRRYWRIFAASLVIVAVSLALAFRLRFDTDVLNLLPRGEPQVETLRQTLAEFGSLDYLLVAVRIPAGAVPDPYESLVDVLGGRLEQEPMLGQVEYRIGEPEELIEAFLPESILFLDRKGRDALLAKTTDASLRARARELRRIISTPQALALKRLILLDPLGISEVFLGQIDNARAGLALDWTSGYFLSHDHRMLLLLAKPVRPPQDVEFSRRLVTRVEADVEAALKEWPSIVGSGGPSPPEIVLGGRYPIALSDEKTIRSDVLTNVVTSLVGVLLLFLFAFRRFGPLIYALVPLASGLALTFGISSLLYGTLSPATSGVAALLIGLGIDFVIVSYGRFVEERHAGRGLSDALARVNRSSGRAVVVGGVTSAATFYAFGVTDFTGLRQMGFLTGTGILCCMVAVLLLLPAMLAWSEDHHERRESRPRLFLHGFGTAPLIRLCQRWPRTVLGVGAALTVAAAGLAFGLRFDDSVQSMRPTGTTGVAIRDEVSQRFGAGFDHMMLVIQGGSEEEVLDLADRAARGAWELVDRGILTGVDSVASVMPPPKAQQEALEWLRRHRAADLSAARIRGTFEAALREEGLRPEPFRHGLELFGSALAIDRPLGVSEIEATPQGSRILQRYIRREAHGWWKTVVYLYPPPKVWRRQAPPEAVALAEALGPNVVLTGANVVSGFLRGRILDDAVIAAILGFLLVALILWLDYHRWTDTLLSLAPLCVGILWMLGGMAALGLSMNFMNIFVTTMIIGIGVDYGIHMIHRFREAEAAGRRVMGSGFLETGKAIAMAALSTMVGFGSLSLSHYPGLRSMGIVAILGAVSTCLVSITLLPAYLTLRVRKP